MANYGYGSIFFFQIELSEGPKLPYNKEKVTCVIDLYMLSGFYLKIWVNTENTH